MANKAINNAGCIVGVVGLLVAIGMWSEKNSPTPVAIPSPLASSSTLWIANKPVNCRSDGNVTAPIIKRLSPRTAVTQVQNSDGWTKVDTDGATCWVSTRLVNTEAPQSRALGLAGAGVTTTAVSAGAAYGTRAYSAKKRRYYASGRSHYRTRGRRSYHRGGGSYYGSGCPCSGSQICIGPRGGRYCITSGGNKRYGV